MEDLKTIQFRSDPRRTDTFEVFSEEKLVFLFDSYHYEARTHDGGETYYFKVLEIYSRVHGLLTPIWDQVWTEIVPGISTREHGITLQRIAGPISVRFEQTRLSRFWNSRTDEDERLTQVQEFWWHCRHITVTEDTEFTEIGKQ